MAAERGAGLQVYIGVDGGSSGLRAAMCDAHGRSLARVDIGGIVPMLRRDAPRRLRQALDGVAAAVPCGATVASAFLALTGIDHPEDAAGRVAHEIGRGVWPEANVVVGNDGLAAWAGATGCLPGVAVMAGTGCVVVASDHRGAIVRTGGWGPLLGDFGGGWGIGLAALREMMARSDAALPPSDLDRRLLCALRASAATEVPTRVTGGRIDRIAVAYLARDVMEAAGHDPSARLVLDRAARDLALDTWRAIGRLEWGDGPITVVTTGNAFHPAYISAFKRAMRRPAGPPITFRSPLLSNVGGAVLLAFRVAGHMSAAIIEVLTDQPELQPGYAQ